jgi:5-oxopent-3-ene-1,2,5-tricarboxylate decarboxylase / 2-hydroxyhepta-2,4-diene-1,7-dioate isomerase
MRVVSFEAPDGYQAVGYLRNNAVYDFSRAFAIFLVAGGFSPEASKFTVIDLLEDGMLQAEVFEEVAQYVEAHGLDAYLRVEEARLLPPLWPNRIIALGRNYAAHAAETGHKPPKEPVFFMKATTSVIAADAPVLCPKNVGRIDPEVELAVVIGKEGKRISRAKAMDYVAGYTILNDVTARDMQTRDMALAHPWFLSKSFDTFGPLGPCITLLDEIPDPHALEISLSVNGEVRQRSNTSQMIFKIPDLIHRLSRYISLEPGDVISTGTPEGIAPVQPGDLMEAHVERIGVLRNPVFAEK